MFRSVLIFGATALCAACVAVADFNPMSDPRIGEPVNNVCYPSGGGGYVELDGADGYVFERGSRSYVAVLSRGCGRLSSPFTYPIISNRGSSCIDRGEMIRVGDSSIGSTGGCSIDNFYMWNADAE